MSEFVPIILPASSNSLYPIDEGMVNELIPVGNKPLIYYSLHYLIKNGFQEIIIVSSEKTVKNIVKSIESYFGLERQVSSPLDNNQEEKKMRIIYEKENSMVLVPSPKRRDPPPMPTTTPVESIPTDKHVVVDLPNDFKVIMVLAKDSYVENNNTIKLLSLCRDYIKQGFMVMPCGLISNMDLSEIANVHREMRSSITLAVQEREQNNKKNSKKNNQDCDYMAHTQDGRLAYFSSTIGEALELDRSFFNRWSNVSFTSSLENIQLYVFSHWIIELICYLVEHQGGGDIDIISLENQLIPEIVSFQKTESIHPSQNLAETLDEDDDALSQYNTEESGIGNAIRKCQIPKLSANQYSSTFHNRDDDIFVYLYNPSQKKQNCIRVNSIEGFEAANKELAFSKCSYKDYHKYSFSEPPNRAVRADVKTFQLGRDSLVSNTFASVGEQITVGKKSIVAQGCTFGSTIKITNSIIMENVTLGNNVTIIDSIIGSNSRVLDNITIESSKLAPGSVVKSSISDQTIATSFF